MLTVACVEVDNYQSRGTEYVQKLRNMVARNTKQAHRFVCISDRKHEGINCQLAPRQVHGWWAKVALFQMGRFEGRVLYLDLDSVVTGSIDELAEHKGIIHLGQWGWKQNDYGSGVMCWDGGEHTQIYDGFTGRAALAYRGDQDYIRAVSQWPALPDGMTRSYRYHCKDGPTDGCAVVCFHGVDKPHSVTNGWVPEQWR